MGQGDFKYNDSKKCQSQTTGKGEGLKISEKGNIILHKGKQSGMKGTIKAKGFTPQGKRVSKLKFTTIYLCH